MTTRPRPRTIRPTAERSVVVVSYKPGAWLAHCLRSALAQADQVILVDNGSEGAAASQVAADAGAEVVRSPTNAGFTGGVALGLSRARGQLVALLNDDAVAGPGWLSAAAAVLEDPTVAAVAPKVLLSGWYRPVTLHDDPWSAPGDSRRLGRQVRSVLVGGAERLAQVGGAGVHRLESDGAGQWRWTAGPVPFWVPIGEDREATVEIDGSTVDVGAPARLINSAGTYLRADGYAGDHGFMAADGPQFDQDRDCFAASGVALVTTAEVLRRVGGLARGFFAYYEDVDWSWRARLCGYRIRYIAAATVDHRRGATSGGEAGEWVRRLAERNRTLTMVRNAPAAVATRHVRDRLTDATDPAVRVAVARALPAALAARARHGAAWGRLGRAVYERWADADLDWSV